MEIRFDLRRGSSFLDDRAMLLSSLVCCFDDPRDLCRDASVQFESQIEIEGARMSNVMKMSAPIGLRRIPPQEMVVSEAAPTGMISPVHEELVSVAEDVQAELLMTIEKILNLADLMNGQATAARQQQAYYEDHIWPAVMNSHDQLNWIANAVRQGIDSCTITENRLNVLLAVNKFRVHIQNIVNYLIDEVHHEIDQVLEFRQRGICGIALSGNLTEMLQKYQKNLRMKILKL
uniref:DHC_N1 domain-containing protein n=1 Tax=Panagrellus redivivus TaxID=6233 RepID=A0A7E4VZ11_PANRE